MTAAFAVLSVSASAVVAAEVVDRIGRAEEPTAEARPPEFDGDEMVFLNGLQFFSDDAPVLTKTDGNGCVRAEGAGSFTAPLELPLGSTINGFVGYVYDGTDGGGFVMLGLTWWSTGSGGPPSNGVDGSVATIGTGTGWQTLTSSDLNHPVREGYTLAILATMDAGIDYLLCGVQVFYEPPAGRDGFTTVAPCVIYDSRTSKGGEGDFAAKERRSIRAVRFSYAAVGGDDSDCGIPAGADALEVSVAVLKPGADGGLRIYPHGAAQPGGDSLVFDAGTSTSASIPVKLGTNDRVYVRNSSNGTASVQLMVLGYYS